MFHCVIVRQVPLVIGERCCYVEAPARLETCGSERAVHIKKYAISYDGRQVLDIGPQQKKRRLEDSVGAKKIGSGKVIKMMGDLVAELKNEGFKVRKIIDAIVSELKKDQTNVDVKKDQTNVDVKKEQ